MGNTESHEMGQTIDRSMASIGCCPNAQNCCMGGRNVVEPEEVYFLLLFRLCPPTLTNTSSKTGPAHPHCEEFQDCIQPPTPCYNAGIPKFTHMILHFLFAFLEVCLCECCSSPVLVRALLTRPPVAFLTYVPRWYA